MFACSVERGSDPRLDVQRAAHLGAAQTAGDLDLHALGARGHHRLGTHLDDATEAARFELLGDGLGHQLRVEVGVLDLDDRDRDLAARHVLELFGHALDLGALGTDHQARTRGLDDDLELLAGALDVDVETAAFGGGGSGACPGNLRIFSSSTSSSP
jgi:hypothetical protein